MMGNNIMPPTQTISDAQIGNLPHSNLKDLVESCGSVLTRKTADEYSTSCPWCGGVDRFLVWPDSDQYYCRQCGIKGDSIQFLRDRKGLTYKDAAKTVGRDDGKWSRQRQREELRKSPELNESETQRQAAIETKKLINTLPDTSLGNPYLKRKGVKPCTGLKEDEKGNLVIPVYGPDGEIMSLQRILPEKINGKDKFFLKGGKIAGGFFIIPGDDSKPHIAESIGTGLSVHEATGCTVYVSFSAGNLETVAHMVRGKYPDSEIVVCGDDDTQTPGNPGRTKAEAAARSISAKVAFPVFKTGTGTDFNDLHVSEGIEAVKRCLEGATVAEVAEGTPENTVSPLRVLELYDFLGMNIAQRTYILAPIIPSQGLVLLYAMRGIGKTNLGLTIAYAAATGQSVCRWQAPMAYPVLYIDGEMPAVTMQEKLAGIVRAYPLEPMPGYFKIITPDLQDRSINLSTPEGQALIEPALDGVKLVIVDNLATLCRSNKKDNETESWYPMQDWLLSLRRRGIAVMLIHHGNKSGGQRGTSSREDILDTVIVLKRPSDYTIDQGARFEVHLEKARGIIGDEAKPFEAILTSDKSRGLIWTCRDIEDVELTRIITLQKEGLSIRDIEKETGLSKSKVQRLLKKEVHKNGK
ncbi:MAG: AAA family ATPase [Desulfatiglans sp.]|nr:AAA family ATPase [Desulfatiglans sp.]